MFLPLGAQQTVDRQRPALGLQQFLKAGFGVFARLLRAQIVQSRREDGEHRLAAGLQPQVQRDGADKGLEGVGENGIAAAPAGVLFAATEAQVLAQFDVAGQRGQRAALDKRHAQAAELPFIGPGKAAIQALADGVTQGAVAEELQAFIVARAYAAMRQRLCQERFIVQTAAKDALQPALRLHDLNCCSARQL